MARGMFVAWLAVAFCAAAWGSIGAPLGAQGRKTVWDKVYTTAQATQGKTTYDTACAGCHAKDLNGREGGGQGPELAGAAFTKKWELQTLNQLFTEIKTRMPRNQPASLTNEEYLNLVAYILQGNKYPAGDAALTSDAALLSSTFITAEASAAATAKPQAITTGTLVQVVGCLQQSGSDWRLTQASAPVRTENPDATPADQRAPLASAPAGSLTIQLLGLYAPPDEHKGKRVEGKGFIVKDPAGDRLNVVSIEMVAPSCGA